MTSIKSSIQIQSYRTKVLIFGLDLFFACCSFCLAIFLTHRLNFAMVGMAYGMVGAVLIAIRAVSYKYFRSYSIIIRYIGEKDYRRAFFAVSSSSAIFAVLVFLNPELFPTKLAPAVIFVDYVILLIFTIGMRILMHSANSRIRYRKSSKTNTAIFGAGELGAMVARVLKHNSSHNYHISLFFDDNPIVHGKFLNGVKILNPKKDFDKIIQKHAIRVAIIGIKTLSEDRRIEFINACLKNKVRVLKIPTTESWINGNLGIGQLEKIKFEDLLNREPIQLHQEAISHTVKNKVIIVTGCAGSIGSEIVRQLLIYKPKRIVGIDQAETPLAELILSLKRDFPDSPFQGIIGDVRDRLYMFRIFQDYQPEYVFHAAAYKHVPMMEDYPEEALKVNVLGTKNLADLAVEFKVDKFVMVSTDKVVNPANVMGASKRIAEIYVQALNFRGDNGTQFITTRFGNVLGSNGSVVPIFKGQIRRREAVTVTHPDVTRFFMTIPEACQLVLEAGTIGNGGEIFVFDMGEPVRILDLAKKMIQMAGFTPDEDIKIKFTGLRPGEKLYEELLDEKEGNIPTHHPKIMKATVRSCGYDDILIEIEKIKEGINQGISGDELVLLMKQIVPEFASKNSTFSALDAKVSK